MTRLAASAVRWSPPGCASRAASISVGEASGPRRPEPGRDDLREAIDRIHAIPLCTNLSQVGTRHAEKVREVLDNFGHVRAAIVRNALGEAPYRPASVGRVARARLGPGLTFLLCPVSGRR